MALDDLPDLDLSPPMPADLANFSFPSPQGDDLIDKEDQLQSHSFQLKSDKDSKLPLSGSQVESTAEDVIVISGSEDESTQKSFIFRFTRLHLAAPTEAHCRSIF